jgi:hypothetical protein
MGRVIWCLGMYASASTWLFNAVRSSALQSAAVQTHFGSGEMDFGGYDPDQINLVKSHEISDEAKLIALAGAAEKIFITLRDPRDAVASVMEYHGHGFDRALHLVEQSARLCAGFAHDRRASLFRYEDRFFDELATVQTIAAALGQPARHAVAQEIFDRLGRQEINEYIAGLPQRTGMLQDRASGDFLDPQTHWHSHHAGRTGKIGRWQEKLSAAQVNEIEARLPGKPFLA